MCYSSWNPYTPHWRHHLNLPCIGVQNSSGIAQLWHQSSKIKHVLFQLKSIHLYGRHHLNIIPKEYRIELEYNTNLLPELFQLKSIHPYNWIHVNLLTHTQTHQYIKCCAAFLWPSMKVSQIEVCTLSVERFMQCPTYRVYGLMWN